MSPDSSSLLEVTFDRRTTAWPVRSNRTLSSPSSDFHDPLTGGFSRASPSLTPAITPTWKRSLVLCDVTLLLKLSFRLVFLCKAAVLVGLSPPLGTHGGLKCEFTWREREICKRWSQLLVDISDKVFEVHTWVPKRWRQPSTMQRNGLEPTWLVTCWESQLRELDTAPKTLQPAQRQPTLVDCDTCWSWEGERVGYLWLDFLQLTLRWSSSCWGSRRSPQPSHLQVTCKSSAASRAGSLLLILLLSCP